MAVANQASTEIQTAQRDDERAYYTEVGQNRAANDCPPFELLAVSRLVLSHLKDSISAVRNYFIVLCQ